METSNTDTKKVAVITGASSGIGMATALKFAEEGYDLVLAARRLEDVATVATECEAFGATTLAVAVDTSKDIVVHQLASEAVGQFGHIDVWVNNAAVYLTGKFQDTPLEDMKRVMDVNFFGYVNGSHAALEVFRAQRYGTIINVSSINAIAPQPYVSAYSASKAAIRSFDESLRMELSLEGLTDMIKVCTVMPGAIDTNLFQNGANYTGHKVAPPEPVYDPTYVARKIFNLTKHPKREIIVGQAAKAMALQHATMPKMYERQIADYTEKRLLKVEGSAGGQGNLYESVPANHGMRGGWREERLRGDQLNTGIAISLATLAGIAGLGVFLIRKVKTARA